MAEVWSFFSFSFFSLRQFTNWGQREEGIIKKKKKKSINYARSQFLAYFVSGSVTATPFQSVQFKSNVHSQQTRQEFLYLDLNVLQECTRNKYDGQAKFISCSAIYTFPLLYLILNGYLGS